MQVPLQISFRDLDHSDAIEARIRDKVEKLERYCDRITSCRVVVESPHRQHNKGKLYHVRIDLSLPGEEIVVARDPKQAHAHEDVYIAIRDTFEAARRQLKKHIRQTRERHTKRAPRPGPEAREARGPPQPLEDLGLFNLDLVPRAEVELLAHRVLPLVAVLTRRRGLEPDLAYELGALMRFLRAYYWR